MNGKKHLRKCQQEMFFCGHTGTCLKLTAFADFPRHLKWMAFKIGRGSQSMPHRQAKWVFKKRKGSYNRPVDPWFYKIIFLPDGTMGSASILTAAWQCHPDCKKNCRKSFLQFFNASSQILRALANRKSAKRFGAFSV